jgi:NAD(P)-dependent dehydrogenase (short-subunit alcohol dehydrogenase family)
MQLGLAGKVALVGGGARGLGRATAEMLGSEGAVVAIFSRGADALEAAAAQIAQRTGARVLPLAADVTSASDCERVVARTVAECGGLDVLVTNMRGPPYGGAADRSRVVIDGRRPQRTGASLGVPDDRRYAELTHVAVRQASPTSTDAGPPTGASAPPPATRTTGSSSRAPPRRPGASSRAWTPRRSRCSPLR